MSLSIAGFRIPHSCVFCAAAAGSRRVCRRCIGVLPWNRTYCDCCGQPVALDLPERVYCAACQKRTPAYVKARSPFRYAFPVNTSLKAMKFRRQLMYVPAFASLLLPVLEEEFAECDVMVAVPSHRWRHVTRGFNQSRELAKELAKGSDLRMVDSVRRIRATRTQSGLSSSLRKKNLRGAFAVCGKLHARYPLVIDDVITTGATCEQMAITLLQSGAERVGVLTVARASMDMNR